MAVPSLRFKEFYDDWKEGDIKSLIKDYKLGGNYANSLNENSFPLIKMGNLGRGNIILDKLEYIEDESVINEGDRICEGDLFFNTRNTLDLVGKVAIWRNELTKAYFNSNLMRMTFSNNYFMNYRLNSYQGLKQLRRIATGTTSVAAIYTKDLLKIKLKTPSLPEQQKIASFLTAVDKRISLLQRKATLLEDYKKGVMQKLFSQEFRFKDDNGQDFPDWEEKKLGELAEISTGKLDANAMVENGEYRFYTCAKEYYRINDYAFDCEALLISGNGANVGYIHYYKGKFNAYQRTYVLFNLNSSYKYLMYFLNQFLKKRIHREKKDGNTPYITISTLSDMIILIPNQEEQQKIASFLESLDKKITSVNQQIEGMQTFKKGLLQQMFV